MTVASAGSLLAAARSDHRGVAAMNVIQIEHAEAIVMGAERAGLPVIIQISQNAIAFHGSLAPLALATLRIAEDSAVPVCVHLDHATDPRLVHEAVAVGIQSVMFDASTRSYPDNVAMTRSVVDWCHERNVAVEAELGEVGGKDGVHAPGVRTKPADAAAYVDATGIDSLAVAVGSSHAMTKRNAELDHDLIKDIAARVDVPLVLHGSSGVPDDGLVAAVAAGMTKINIATHLNVCMTRGVRTALRDAPTLVDPRTYIGAGRDAVAIEAARLVTLLANPPAECLTAEQ